MLKWLRRRRLDEGGRRRLLVALARAEEELVETHVRNALHVIDSVDGELPAKRVLEIYLEAFDPGEPRSSIIVRRVLTRFDPEDDAGGRRRRRRAIGD